MSAYPCELPAAALWSRFLGVVVLLILTLGGKAAAAEASTEGTFSGGRCRLVVRSVSQERWPGREERWGVQLQLQLEFPGAQPHVVLPLMPENFFLIAPKSPLLAAYLPGERRNIAQQEHLSAAAGGAFLLVSNLMVGRARPRLERVELAIELARITEWETREALVVRGDNPAHSFGPFEIKTWGEGRAVRVELGEYPEFNDTRKAYRRAMPLSFLDQSYGETAIRLVDAEGRASSGSTSQIDLGGSPDWKRKPTVTTYSSWFGPKGVYGDDVLTYPVRASVRLPKAYVVETVGFRFDAIELPMPESPQKD